MNRRRSIIPVLVVLPYIIYLLYRDYGVTFKSGLIMVGLLGTIGATALVYANNRKLAVPFYVVSLIILAMTYFL